MAETLTLEDDRGNSNEFALHPIGTNYKEEPGVYAFIREENDAWTIVYIGETDDLKDRLTTRLKQHHRYQCAVVQEKASHLLTRIVGESDQARLNLETRLREHYDPVCNRQ